MRKNDQKPRGGGRNNNNNNNNNNSFIPTSFRALSNYLRIVSSGASTVASTVRSAASAASAIVDRDNNDAIPDQVHWAGFDKLECEGKVFRQVLLLGYQFGFQVWDVEEANNVRDLVTRYDGPVSFIQVLPKPIASKHSREDVADSGPLLVICADGSFSAGASVQDGVAIPLNGNVQNSHDQLNGSFMPTAVWFYSLKSQSYVHVLKFRSVVYSVRCSSRVVAVLQASQVHCFDATTLEREYTILTNPISTSCTGFGSIGLGPLAVGPRWIAYSGSLVALSNSGRVSPQHLTPSASFPSPASNGSVVAHYAKESSKQLAAGIVNLGDIGYKKLTRYYSELLPDGNNSQQGNSGWKDQGTPNGHLQNADNVGMVIVRDVVSKMVIAQFQAHKSPISSLCFDPSGIILVTASVQGHNINVFRVMPGLSGRSSGPESGASYVHLYRLQRGFTNAVIQDISFSVDGHWIMISSSRGTSHLFAISPSGGPVNIQSAEACYNTNNSWYNANTKLGSPNLGPQMLNQQILRAYGPPITLSAVSRIRSGNSGWRSTVTGAAVAATGRVSSLSGAIASTFHNCKGNTVFADADSLMGKYHILVFSPSGCVIQYALRLSSGLDSITVMPGLSSTYESAPEFDSRLVVEAIQKWTICQKQNRREREENIDIYGENGYSDSRKVFPEGTKKESGVHFEGRSKVKKEKVSPEERHHMFISEAELQMHQPRIPLWTRPQMYFQSMMTDDVKMDEEDVPGGEFEIERVPTNTIEARSKDLLPAVDYLPVPKFQTTRVPALDCNSNGCILHQRPGLSEYGRLPRGSNGSSLEPLANGVVAAGELDSGKEEIVQDALPMPIEDTKGFVNNDDNLMLHTRLEIVNNREGSASETQSEFVNNNIESLKTENRVEDRGDEFD